MAIRSLLMLQDVDGRIRDLEQEIKSAPTRKTQELSRLEATKRAAEFAANALKQGQSKVANLELEVNALKEQELKQRQTQATLKTNKEFQALNLEIDRLKQDTESVEARWAVAGDDLVPLRGRLAEAEAELAAEQAIVAEYQEAHDERFAMIQQEFNNAQAERTELEKAVPPQFLAYYERIRQRRWPAIVRLNADAGVCGGCNLVQTPATRQRVIRGGTLVACESCGRILYTD